jgi:hypothetical protein
MKGNYPVSFSKKYDTKTHTITLALPPVDTGGEVTVRFKEGLSLADNCVKQRIFDLLNTVQIEYELKEKIYHSICAKDAGMAISELQAMDLSSGLLGAISEILFAL